MNKLMMLREREHYMKAPKILFVALIVLCCYATSFAQRHFTDLPRIGIEIEHRIRNATPEWAYRPVQPASINEFAVNDKVVIGQWTSGRRIARVALVQHQSVEESTIALRQFAADKKTNNQIQGLGTEAYLCGVRGSIAFREANLTVYVSAVVIEDSDDEAIAGSESRRRSDEQSAREEEAVVTRGFAAQVAAILRTF